MTRLLIFLVILGLAHGAWAHEINRETISFKMRLLKARFQHEAGVYGAEHHRDCDLCYQAAEEGRNPWDVLNDRPVEKLRRMEE